MKSVWIFSAIIVIVIVVAGALALMNTNPAAPSIDGIECATEQTTYHIHAHLDVIVNGTQRYVPADIGITSNCLYWLHTHDTSGIIHVETPGQTGFTIGQFLDVWNSTMGNAPGAPTAAYVNGAPVSDYRSITITPYEEIALVYGNATNVPSSYSFPTGY